MTKFRFAIPAAPVALDAAVTIEAEKYRREFDEFFAHLILQRIYRRHAVLNITKIAPISAATMVDQVRIHINPALISCICSNDPELNHNVRIPKNAPYVREDKVTYMVRRIVEVIYPRAHKEFHRQKTVGCMNTILNAVGNINFKAA